MGDLTYEDFLCIIFWILISWIAWHLTWKILLKTVRDSFEALLIASVLQSVQTVFAYILESWFVEPGNWEMQENNCLEVVSLTVSAGFFLHDTPHWTPKLTLKNVTYLLHHVVSLVALTSILLFGAGGSLVVELSALMELSTPLLLVRYYQKEMGISSKEVEIAYAVLYTVLRFWYGTNLSVSILFNEDVPFMFKMFCGMIYLTSVGLYPGIVRMAFNKGVARRRNTTADRTSTSSRGLVLATTLMKPRGTAL